MMVLNETVSRLQGHWRQLSQREKILSAAGAGALCLMLIVNGVINPVIERKEQVQRQLESSRRLYAEVITGAEKIKSLQAQGSVLTLEDLSRPADERVRRAAQSNNIAIHRLTMQQNSMQVQLGEVPFSALIRWLEGLEQQGIIARSLQINHTATPGIVTVDQLRLEEGHRG